MVQHNRGMNKYKKIMYVAKYVRRNMVGAGPVCSLWMRKSPRLWRDGGRTVELQTMLRDVKWDL